MRLPHVPPLVVLVLLLLTAGCSSNNKGKIEGSKWSVLAATVKGNAIPAGALKLEFRADGTMVYEAGPQTFTGRYNLGSGDYLTMNLDQPLAGNKTHTEKVVISGNQLTMTDSDGTQLTFTKTN